jgi:hypothetical protein
MEALNQPLGFKVGDDTFNGGEHLADQRKDAEVIAQTVGLREYYVRGAAPPRARSSQSWRWWDRSGARLEQAALRGAGLRAWPKPLHGFGVGTREMVLGLLWHSVDSSTWEKGPGAFLRWGRSADGGCRSAVAAPAGRGRVFLELERLARHRWRREMGHRRQSAVVTSPVRPAAEHTYLAERARPEDPQVLARYRGWHASGKTDYR